MVFFNFFLSNTQTNKLEQEKLFQTRRFGRLHFLLSFLCCWYIDDIDLILNLQFKDNRILFFFFFFFYVNWLWLIQLNNKLILILIIISLLVDLGCFVVFHSNANESKSNQAVLLVWKQIKSFWEQLLFLLFGRLSLPTFSFQATKVGHCFVCFWTINRTSTKKVNQDLEHFLNYFELFLARLRFFNILVLLFFLLLLSINLKNFILFLKIKSIQECSIKAKKTKTDKNNQNPNNALYFLLIRFLF